MRKPLYTLCFLAIAGVFIPGAYAQTLPPPVIQWQECLGGSGPDLYTAISMTADGGYIVAGCSASDDGDVTGLHGADYDYWVVKLSDSGAIQWQKALGGSMQDEAAAIIQTYDHGYIIAGSSNSTDGDVTGNHGGYDYWVVKLNDTGGIQWERSYGGGDYDAANSIIQTSDSGYIVAGGSSSMDGDVTGNHDSSDCWVIKLSATGAIQWEKSYGGSGTDWAGCIQQTYDGGYIMSCSSTSADGDVTGSHGMTDIWIVKLSRTGAIQWQRPYGGSGVDDVWYNTIRQTYDSGYIVVGGSSSTDGDVTGNHGRWDAWVFKLSAAGNIQWEKSYGGSNLDGALAVQLTTDSGYIVAGYTYSDDYDVTTNFGGGDIWIMKLSDTGKLQWQQTLGGTGLDVPICIQQTGYGSYILSGYTNSDDSDVSGNHGDTDYWIVKLGIPFVGDTTVTDSAKTGVSSISGNQPISITPNPTTGTITIEAAGNVTIHVYNTLGQLVKEAIKTDNISIAGFPDGMYFISVCDEAGNLLKTDKIIKR